MSQGYKSNRNVFSLLSLSRGLVSAISQEGANRVDELVCLCGQRGAPLSLLKQSIEQQKQTARKTYHFRIYPTRKQAQTLEQWLGLCC